jgi:hypothetical protein
VKNKQEPVSPLARVEQRKARDRSIALQIAADHAVENLARRHRQQIVGREELAKRIEQDPGKASQPVGHGLPPGHELGGKNAPPIGTGLRPGGLPK